MLWGRLLRASRRSALPVSSTGEQLACRFAMASQTQRTHIGEVAFSSAFGYGNHVIGVPEALPRKARQSPPGEEFVTLLTPRALQSAHRGKRVGTTLGANTTIALEHTIPQMRRIAAQFPLLHAPVRTETAPALWYFEVAPAAQRAPAFALRQIAWVHPTAGHAPLLAEVAGR